MSASGSCKLEDLVVEKLYGWVHPKDYMESF
jgi:hypothetical protein